MADFYMGNIGGGELEGGGNRVDVVDRLEDMVNVTFIRSEKVNS